MNLLLTIKKFFSKLVLHKTLLLLALFTANSFNVFAQNSSLISDCDDFISGPNETWTHVLVATTIADGAASQEAQTYTMNIASLPTDGANFRVYKTTANGSDFFGNPIALTLGSNSITVDAVAFDRAVKFQFSSGDVEFDDLSLNGEDSECVVALPPPSLSLISDCNDFIAGPNATWTNILVATTIADGAASQGAQSFTMNVTSLPVDGANFRVYKTTANGNDSFGDPVALVLGSNSITVDAVAFDRAVKFQFSSGDVEFDALSLNGEDSECVCNASFVTDLIEACDSYIWIDGNTYISSNSTATYLLTNSVGCDSVITLDLTINESNTGTDTQVAIDSFTWIDGVTYSESNNIASFTLTNINNCDSVVTLNLTINNSANIDDFEVHHGIQLFPNPTTNDLTISLDGIDFVDIIISDIQGKILLNQSTLFDQDRINLSNYKAGTYFVRIITPEISRKIRVIKL